VPLRPCHVAPDAGTAYIACMQYTLRNIPPFLDRALRRLARERGASLNEVALDALTRGAGLTAERVQRRELGDLAGRWQEDPEFDEAIRQQDTVDPVLWG
jgi:hypothetical protein